MTDPVRIVPASPSAAADRQGDPPPASAPPPAATAAAPTPTQKTADEPLRLVIEPSGAAGGYTYKLFDRVTGQLLIELPRDDAEKMSVSPDYSAGQVYSATA